MPAAWNGVNTAAEPEKWKPTRDYRENITKEVCAIYTKWKLVQLVQQLLARDYE